MKRGIKIFEMALCVCAALGWWGVFYPELTMTPDTYRVVSYESICKDDTVLKKEVNFKDDKKDGKEGIIPKEDASQKENAQIGLPDSEVYETADWDFDREIYFEILQADASQIRFKSKLLMSLREIFE